MHVVQFFLPLYDKRGRRFGRAKFDQVLRELTSKFGGVTAFVQSPALGLWKKKSATEKDRMVLFEVMVKRFDRRFWRRYRDELATRFAQDEVLVRAFRIDTP